jgi:hypothetical protein
MEKNAHSILATKQPENAQTSTMFPINAHLEDNVERTLTAMLGLLMLDMI